MQRGGKLEKKSPQVTDMNRGGKLGKKSTPVTQTTQQKLHGKEKQNSSNPLKEPNSNCSTSVEAPRGCFRFLLSNSSSKTTLPRSKSLPRTPKSAPNARNLQKTATNTSNPRSGLPKKNPPKPSFETPNESGSHNSQKPKSSYLLQWQSGKRPIFGGRYRERDQQSEVHMQQQSNSEESETGKSSQPKFMTVLEDDDTRLNELASGFCPISTCDYVLKKQSSTQPPDLSSSTVLEMNATPVNKLSSGSCLVSTPYKALDVHFATPPLLVSVSPEIDSGKASGLRTKPQIEINGALGAKESKFSSGSCFVYDHGKTFEEHYTVRPHDLSFRGVLEMNATPITELTSGSCLVSPDKALGEHFTITTPPSHVSVSPQVDSSKPSQLSARTQLVIDGTPADKASKLSIGSLLVYVHDQAVEEHSTVQPPKLKFKEVLEMNATPVNKSASGSCLISTPCEALDKHFRTPPLQFSVSPNLNSGEPSELRLNLQSKINGTPARKASKLLSGSSFLYAHNRALEEKFTMPPPDLSFRDVLEMNATPINKSTSGSCLLSTPDTMTTPPIQASISPEIMRGSSLVSTPACFAAGHVVVGISDKRKCRPRGILTVEEEFKNPDVCTSRVSLVPAPAEASMNWLMSPDEGAKKSVTENASPEFKGLIGPTTSGESVFRFSDNRTVKVSLVPSPTEASMNWLLSSCDGSKNNLVDKSSPDLEGSMIPSTPASDAAPLSSHKYCDSSGVSTTSTCPKISKGSAVSFGSKVLAPQNERSYGYSNMVENSPFSTRSWGSRDVICTQLSNSGSDKHGWSSRMNMEDLSKHQLDHNNTLVEDIQYVSLSSESRVITCDLASISPITHVNFQFSRPVTPPNSINITKALKPMQDQTFRKEECGKLEEGMSSSNLENVSRISWREGLVSRIFNMGELDCCQWLSEEEEDANYCRDGLLKPDSGLEFNTDVTDFTLSDENDALLRCGFGSPSIIYGQDNQKIKGKLPSLEPISCAESIGMEMEGSRLIASGDSDWTIFYKNKLFEL